MVDSKNNTDKDRALKISIETIIKDPEMLRLKTCVKMQLRSSHS